MFKGSIVALVTPFTEEGEIDFAVFDALIHWHIEAKTDAIVLCGITGESPTLTPEEHQAIITRGVLLAKGRVPIIAGTGCASTAMTLQLTEQAKKAGADACLVIVPYCNRPTPQGCLEHYRAISKLALPMIVYHHPSRTNVRLPVDTLKEILSLAHVVGIKEGSCDLALINELLKETQTPLFCGDDYLALAMMAQGAQGVISIVANVIPQQWKEMCAYLLNSDLKSAKQLYFSYHALIEAMTLEINPQCVKYALSLLGRCSSSLRLPLTEPREETRKKIREALDSTIYLNAQSSSLANVNF